ncbi:MAG: hypothetical protein Q9226_004483 [Calogaya cf. arnoldii]
MRPSNPVDSSTANLFIPPATSSEPAGLPLRSRLANFRTNFRSATHNAVQDLRRRPRRALNRLLGRESDNQQQDSPHLESQDNTRRGSQDPKQVADAPTAVTEPYSNSDLESNAATAGSGVSSAVSLVGSASEMGSVSEGSVVKWVEEVPQMQMSWWHDGLDPSAEEGGDDGDEDDDVEDDDDDEDGEDNEGDEDDDDDTDEYEDEDSEDGEDEDDAAVFVTEEEHQFYLLVGLDVFESIG